MTERNHRQHDMSNQDLENDPLDRELDAANYAAVEPRAGLEQRILANLRAEQKHASVRSWWRWPAVSAISAAVVAAALLLASKFGKPTPHLTAHPRYVPAITLPAADSQTSGNNRPGGTGPILRKKPLRVAHHRENENASAPKLDVFPSPQPLSEQEKMLAAYVAQHRQQAVLIARARMAELKEDLAKETDEQNAAPNRRPSDQFMSQQEQSTEDR
jgi:hypothetical protein